MNTIKQEIIEQFRSIMAEEISLVVSCVNGETTFDAIRTNRTRDGLLLEVGRGDPEMFALRGVMDDAGTIRNGKPLTVAGEECTIKDANPDSAGAIIEIICQKRRVAT